MDEQGQKDMQATDDERIESQGKEQRADEVEAESSGIESQNDQGDESVNDGSASFDSGKEADAGESPNNTKHRSLNKKYIAIVAAAVFGVVAIAATIFNALMVGMPDIHGMVPSEAHEELLDVSESWAVEFVTDEGESVAVESLEDYGGYEVKETEPSAGTFLGRSDESACILVTIGKTEETLQQERQAIIDAEIADSLANGFEREEYEDGGTYVLFKAYGSESIPAGYYMSAPTVEGDSSVELYRTMAAQLKSSVLCACYTQDGYLYCLYYAPYSEASEGDLATDTEVLKGVVQEALTFNREHAQAYLDAWCVGLQERHRQIGRPLTCEYTLESDNAVIYLMYDWADMEHVGNAREINEARANDQEATNWLAWCLGRKTSMLTYTSENELFDSFNAEAADYDPLIVIDPAPTEE